jgi:hypothetical protein
MREGLIWSKLDHPNILPLLGFVDDDEAFQPFGAFISPVSRTSWQEFSRVSFESGVLKVMQTNIFLRTVIPWVWMSV